MTEMFGEAWSPMSVPDLAPDDDDDVIIVMKLWTLSCDTIRLLDLRNQVKLSF